MVFLTVLEVELLVRFLAYTGVRINVVLALQIQDLDFRNRKARIRRTWSDDGEGRMQLGTQKNGEARTIALPQSLIPQLEEQNAGQSKNEFLFRAKRGGCIHDQSWRTRIWYPGVRNAGMEGEAVNIHSHVTPTRPSPSPAARMSRPSRNSLAMPRRASHSTYTPDSGPNDSTKSPTPWTRCGSKPSIQARRVKPPQWRKSLTNPPSIRKELAKPVHGQFPAQINPKKKLVCLGTPVRNTVADEAS